jgi:hypothetical protein
MAYDDHNEPAPLVILAETEHFAVLVGEDEDGEPVYNLELGSMTLHLFREEWDELVAVITEANDNI